MEHINNFTDQLKIKYWPLLLLIIPCVSGWLGYTGHGFFFKAGVAGSGILLLLLFCPPKLSPSGSIWLILAAFAFSIGGDWFLSHRHGSTIRFIYGIILFFIAHIGYLGYAIMNGRINRKFTALLLACYLIFFILVIYPSIQETGLMIAVLAYLVISCFSLGAAVGISFSQRLPAWLYIFGIAMVLLSDTIIALREFAHYNSLSFAILPTYYLAQIGITFSLLLNKIQGKNSAFKP